jgi:hypothetical protein
VDPIVTVPSPGGGSFAEDVTNGGVTTHQKFVPRGAEYIRLAPVTKAGRTTCAISTFDVGTGPDAYNPHRAAQALAAMEHYGYNVVRVGFNASQSGQGPSQGPGKLNPAYWANVASFINIARSDNVRVEMVLMPLPSQYVPTPQTVPLPVADQRRNGNLYYLESAYLTAQQNYVSDVITTLKADQANMSDIFSFELQGETYFKSNVWPLDLNSGTVATVTGEYDMASATSRDNMMDESTLHWENTLAQEIHTDLPGSLVAVGFTQGLAAYPEDRIGRSESSLTSSSLVDYIDFHMYPIFGTMSSQVAAIGVPAATVTKPIILGEFGEYVAEAPTPEAAASHLVAWQEQSCHVEGFRFDGWLAWTWDIPLPDGNLYNMVDGGEAIAKALAPSLRPNACASQPTSSSASVNPPQVSGGQPVTYSSTVRGSGGTPTGTVTFRAGSTLLCSAALSAGSGSCASPDAPVGSDEVSATYSGDAIHAPSSATTSLQVSAPPVNDGSLPAPIVGMAALPDGFGYWLVDAQGGVSGHGAAVNFGSVAGLPLNAPITHIVSTPDGNGYWLVAADGGTFAFGNAGFYGSMGGQPLNAPVVDIAPTSNGQGYWLVASDGGIFAFGDARFDGSMGGQPLNRPVVGIAADDQTGGYWEVASDGGVFAFGAPFFGSAGALPLNEPVNGMAPAANDQGYLFVASDGGIFTFGDVQFYGSMGGSPLNAPVVGAAVDNATGGYWLVSADGGIFAFGALFYGAD